METPIRRHVSTSAEDVEMTERSLRREYEAAGEQEDEQKGHRKHLNHHDDVHRDREVN